MYMCNSFTLLIVRCLRGTAVSPGSGLGDFGPMVNLQVPWCVTVPRMSTSSKVAEVHGRPGVPCVAVSLSRKRLMKTDFQNF